MDLLYIPEHSIVTLRILTAKVRVDLVGVLRRGEGGNWTVAPGYQPGFAGTLAVFQADAVTSTTQTGSEFFIEIDSGSGRDLHSDATPVRKVQVSPTVDPKMLSQALGRKI